MSLRLYETTAHLATAIYQGDKDAEAALFERFYKPVLYVLERKTGDPEQAQDLCQESLCIMIERLRTQPLAEPDKLSSFLHQIAHNLHIAEVRKSERRQTHANLELLERCAAPGQNQLRQLLLQRSKDAVHKLIAALPNERDRKLLYGYYIEERDKDELCAELELSQRHFDKVLFRAKQRFKELVLEDDKR